MRLLALACVLAIDVVVQCFLLSVLGCYSLIIYFFTFMHTCIVLFCRSKYICAISFVVSFALGVAYHNYRTYCACPFSSCHLMYIYVLALMFVKCRGHSF